MTVSIRVITAGQGFRYLLNSVAVGDGHRDAADALTRYYEQTGTPPGRWHGTGLAGLAHPPAVGDEVTEQQLRRLLGHGQDPTSGDQLGRPFRQFAPADERIQRRVDKLPPTLEPAERQAEVTRIEQEEAERDTPSPVAGFDLTFSAPKSVSSLWAVADAGTQALIARAHHEAMQDVLDLLEREVAMTRVGAAGPRGAVAQVEVTGVIAAAYDHWDSRSADPQLHTHLVVSNRVQTVRDGQWRTLDSRALHQAVTGLSEHYNALLSDRVAAILATRWEARERGPGRSTAWELAGVPQDLMDAFSSRTRAIEDAKDRLVEAYIAKHGRRPSKTVLWQIRQQATLETRPEKEVVPLSELTERWRARAAGHLDAEPPVWASLMLAETGTEPLLRADDLPAAKIDDLALAVLNEVEQRRSTWKRWHLHAEAVRQSMPYRFASTTDREAIVGMVADAAERASLALTPPELVSTPQRWQRSDGSSAFRPRHATVYSSTQILDAEDRLLAASRDRAAPTVPLPLVEHFARTPFKRGGPVLSPDQEQAVTRIAVSGRSLDGLVGPAGSGKTATMGALRRAWELEHGPGAVVGLAPSAAAAAVLGEDLGVRTENTAKRLFEHQLGRWDLQAGQLVILDEASLAGTLAIDQITTHATDVGAKVLLVGDPHQLTAVDAGGAFGLVVRDLDDTGGAPRLSELHRFRHDWEKTASLQVRLGDTDAIDEYISRDRVHSGAYDDILEGAYQAWQADRAAGKTSLLIAETLETVSALNARARTDRIAAGEVDDTTGVVLHDGNQASRGDIIVTRRNDRRLSLGRGWVKNGDRWIVTNARADGSLTVRREHSRWRTTITLPADYVESFVELGYAVTAHRSQGSTVDTAHAIVHSPEMTRESLYVSLTRGREANHVWVATDQAHLEAHQHRDGLTMTARSILFGILQHLGVELSAHETIVQEQEDSSSVGQLAAEYETIAVEAQARRWMTVLASAGLTQDQLDEVAAADSFGVLSAELRRLEAAGHRVDQLLAAVTAAGCLENVEDIGSLLRHRVMRLAERYQPATRERPDMIAGLIPRAEGDLAPADRAALDEREQLIEARVDAVLDRARTQNDPWLAGLPEPTSELGHQSLRVIAAYRDRWQISAASPLGGLPDNDAQRIDHQRAGLYLNTLVAEAEDLLEPSTQRAQQPRHHDRGL
ncbi:MobF family relaxase [Brevibacterium luteolum]|uniref:Conjugal transfer protein n=1 Tax=Brevibacterium luteolum TaxID=199591 RepID=A0A6G8KTP8_9MICO|nr:MobF family relaxase [Brevibacterium luteolum]QIN28148.1 conjugal transfer protein [Brevibacterium luteolum]